jgi:hypothetical protein
VSATASRGERLGRWIVGRWIVGLEDAMFGV